MASVDTQVSEVIIIKTTHGVVMFSYNSNSPVVDYGDEGSGVAGSKLVDGGKNLNTTGLVRPRMPKSRREKATSQTALRTYRRRYLP